MSKNWTYSDIDWDDMIHRSEDYKLIELKYEHKGSIYSAKVLVSHEGNMTMVESKVDIPDEDA